MRAVGPLLCASAVAWLSIPGCVKMNASDGEHSPVATSQERPAQLHKFGDKDYPLRCFDACRLSH
jgi:hypothetical protein